MNSPERSGQEVAGEARGAAFTGDMLAGNFSAQLAEGLAQPCNDLDVTTRTFDLGLSAFGDVGSLNGYRRAVVLGTMEQPDPQLDSQQKWDAFQRTISGLYYAMTPNAYVHGSVRDNAGLRFIAQAAAERELGLPSADSLDRAFQRRTKGLGLGGLLFMHHDNPEALAREVTDLMSDPKNASYASHYAAESSRFNEVRQWQQHGEMLNDSKGMAIYQLETLAARTGLRPEFVERAKGQMMRAGFGSGDRVTGLYAAMATVAPTSLRMDVNVDGLPVSQYNLQLGIYHELLHTGQAESIANTRAGLVIGPLGRRETEALIDTLSHLAFGLGDTKNVEESVANMEAGYPYEIRAMYRLMTEDFGSFAALYNAHYGQVDDVRKLAYAIRSFNINFQSLNLPEGHLTDSAIAERARRAGSLAATNLISTD